MKRKLLFLLTITLLLFNTGFVTAQTISATTYPFTKAANSSTEPMNQPPDGILLIGSGVDEGASALTNIGFEFWFAGTRYTQFSVESNGLLKLGSPVITPEPVNNLASSTNSPIITPYWDNLVTELNNVLYKVYGTAPNRKLVVQWFPGGKRIQAWLWESGKIEFVYGSVAIPANGNGYSIGIGSSSTQFASITTTATTNNSTVAYGVANNSNTLQIAARQKFTFTPTLPAAPTNLTFANISLNGMQLNWTDAADEIGYAIYSSVDNVNFNFVGQVGANVTSYDALGLNSGIRYYWKVHSIREVLSNPLTGSQTTTLTPLLGTYTIGPTGDFPSLLSALYTLNGSGFSGPGDVIFELQATYQSSVESFPLIIPSTLPTSATNTLTIRPAADALGLSITSSAAQTISLDGADYVTFDGRPGGLGNSPQLKIDNTFGTGVALQLINAAQNNSILYCELTGVNTSTSTGIVVLGTTTTAGTVGNSNNLIDHCNIHDGATKPAVLLLSSGTTGKLNENNTISNCNFYNWNMGNSAANTRALSISLNSFGTVITGNSFYQTTPTTGISQSTNAFIGLAGVLSFTNNYLGGTAPQCGGTPMSLTYQTYYGNIQGISIAGTGNPLGNTSIQGNTIQNIQMIIPSGQGGSFTAINQSQGFAEIGTITPNIIGSQTVANSISLSTSSTSWTSSFVGIAVSSSSSTDKTTISNNVIGGVNLSGSGIASFTGINAGAYYTLNMTVTGNTIGSTTMANAISNSTTGTVTGIYGSGRNNNVIAGNTIANLTQLNSVATGNQLIGLSAPGSSAGVFNVSNNAIYNLTSASASIGTGSASSVIGLAVTATSAGQVISQNRIYGLSNTNPSAATNIIGLYYAGPASGTNVVSRNFIHGLTLASGATTASINGIYANAGLTNYQNNMVQMGIDASGTEINIGYNIHGIFDAAGTNSYYNNSVYVGGAGVTGTTSNTFAFKSAVLTNTRAFQNNIFVNARSGGSTGKHYAITVAGTAANPAGLTSSNNLLYSLAGPLGLFNGTDQASLAEWKSATGQDAGSLEADPNFVNPTGNSSSLDLHVQNLNPIEGSGVPVASVTDDYDGELRSSLSPVDVGADAGDFTNNLCVSPTSGGTIAASGVTVGCDPFNPDIINSTAAAGGQTGTLIYKWQYSVTDANTGFSDIASSNVESYDPGSLSVTTWFKRLARVDCKADWVGAVESNVVMMTVNPVPVVTTANTSTICSGTSPAIALTASIESTFTWIVGTVTGGITGASNGSGGTIDQVLTNTGTVAGTVEYLVTPTSVTGTCAVTAYTITVTVNPIIPVSVNVFASQNPTCPGTTVTFFANPTNGGTSPVYVWKVNNKIVGSNANSYAYIPANGDVVRCEVTANVTCPSANPAVSNAITMVVGSGAPTISIATTTGTVCAQGTLNFIATVSNEGAAPTFQWKVNGTPAGNSSPQFTYTAANYTQQTIDVVTCEMVSNSPCASATPVVSNGVNITVNPILTASVTIAASANPVAAGTSVTFTPTPVNGGSIPTYECHCPSVIRLPPTTV